MPEATPAQKEADAHFRRGKELAKNRQWDAAIDEFQQAVRLNPQDADAHQELARAFRKRNRGYDAAGEYREALRVKPDDYTIHRELFRVLVELEAVDDALAEFQDMLQLRQPSELDWVELGLVLYRVRAAGVAKGEFRLLTQNHSNPASLHYHLSFRLQLAGRFEAALAEAREAAQLRPNERSYQENLQRTAEVKETTQRNTALVRQIVAQQPNRAEARALLGLNLMLGSDWRQGREELLAALRLGLDDREPLEAVAWSLLNQKGRPFALAEFREYIERFPQIINLRVALAMLLMQGDELEEAAAELREVLASDRERADVHDLLARILQGMGDSAGAEAERELAEKLAAQQEEKTPPYRQLVQELAALLTGERAASKEAKKEEARPSPSEMAAVGAVRTLNTALIQYMFTYDRGYPPSLAQLGPAPDGQPSAEHADLIDAELASGTRAGYVFTYVAGAPDAEAKIQAYEIYADPAQAGEGLRFFFTNESGVIRFNRNGRASAADEPIS